MESVEKPSGKDRSHSSNESLQESFEQHLERMKIFRKSHDLAESRKSSGAPDVFHARIEPPVPHEFLSTLLITGYILNLINEHGTAVLSRNWQN